PDVCCLQEIKCEDGKFPAEPIESLGYNIAVHGQKGFNGVAILSKRPFDEVIRALPGDDGDVQARYLEVVIPAEGGVVRVASVYLPNGNPLGSEKFAYKLAWMDRLAAHAKNRLALEEPLVISGDLNVIPTPLDAKIPANWTDDALFQPETRARFRALVHLGFTDSLRALNPTTGLYTFWDYQAGAWQKDNGIRIDFSLLSPQAADRLLACRVDRHVRGWEKPSDHVPVVIDLAA
ncbi:MAG: exodeoxyribonuclease III, partial [Hyphomicrobiales bacterium]